MSQTRFQNADRPVPIWFKCTCKRTWRTQAGPKRVDFRFAHAYSQAPTMRIRALIPILVPSLALVIAAYGSVTYTATDLGTLGAPTFPYAINSSGQIVGTS